MRWPGRARRENAPGGAKRAHLCFYVGDHALCAVTSVVALFDREATAEEIVQSFPTLTPGDVYVVLGYRRST